MNVIPIIIVNKVSVFLEIQFLKVFSMLSRILNQYWDYKFVTTCTYYYNIFFSFNTQMLP